MTKLEQARERVEDDVEVAAVFTEEYFAAGGDADTTWLRWGDAALADVGALRALDRAAGEHAARILCEVIHATRERRFAAKARRSRPSSPPVQA